MRLKLLAAIARVLGIQFKVDGLPYGAEYRPREPGVVQTAARTGKPGGSVPGRI